MKPKTKKVLKIVGIVVVGIIIGIVGGAFLAIDSCTSFVGDVGSDLLQ